MLTYTNPLQFQLHGIQIEIYGNRAEEIGFDFSYFRGRKSQTKPTATIQLEVQEAKPDSRKLPNRKASSVFPDCVQYKCEDALWCDYHGQALLHVTRSSNHVYGSLTCANPALIGELGYLFLQSQIGFFLENQGMFRIHGLGFSHKEGEASLFLAPSGGGKTTLARKIMETKGTILLSEDTPLITSKGQIAPFPLSQSFRSPEGAPPSQRNKLKIFNRRKHGKKYLLSTDDFPEGTLPLPFHTFQPRAIFIGRRWGSRTKPLLTRAPRTQILPYLTRDLIIGLGVPQVAELVLTGGASGLAKLLTSATRRSQAAIRLLQQSQCYFIDLSTDSNSNADLILEELDRL